MSDHHHIHYVEVRLLYIKKILKLKFQVRFFLHFTETIKSSMALAISAIFSTTTTKPNEKFVWMENWLLRTFIQYTIYVNASPHNLPSWFSIFKLDLFVFSTTIHQCDVLVVGWWLVVGVGVCFMHDTSSVCKYNYFNILGGRKLLANIVYPPVLNCIQLNWQ